MLKFVQNLKLFVSRSNAAVVPLSVVFNVCNIWLFQINGLSCMWFLPLKIKTVSCSPYIPLMPP